MLGRVDAVEVRLARQSVALPGGLTDPDQPSGERWEAGQVWAHMAEILPYWIAQANVVISGGASGEGPVPFGRVKSNSDRIAAIEGRRQDPLPDLWKKVKADIERLRSFIRSLPEAAWDREGSHQTLGTMDVKKIVEEFMVGHLEQHADQLDSLGH